jgi:homoserine O-succinyltransferase/O-acetyltransferase
MPLLIEEPRAPPRAGEILIGLVNNMPDAALEATERQFGALLAAAAGEHRLRLRLSCLPELPRGSPALARMRKRYFPLEALLAASPDALIVTGTEPRALTLEEEPYWASLLGLIRFAQAHTASSLWSCLAAHALVQALAGIRRRRQPEKRFGLFEHDELAPHKLLRGVSAPLVTPHSRWNDLPPGELARAGFRVLAASQACGADLFVWQGRSLLVCFQGHPEYEADTLLKEYRRDVGRFLRGEQPAWPEPPERYFSGEALAALAQYRLRAERRRDPRLFEQFPSAALAAGLAMPWRRSALAVYRNWLDLLAAARVGARPATPPRPCALSLMTAAGDPA